MYDKQQNDRTQPRGQIQGRPNVARGPPDRMYSRCRTHDPIFVTAGPPIPEHVLSQTCKVAANISAGYLERRPMWVLGLRPGDASTQKLASRLVRGHVETLRDDHATLLQYWQTDRSQTCKARSIFQAVMDNFPLEPGRPWTLWAFRHMWDQRPVALKTGKDVLFFLEENMRELSAGPTQGTPMMQPGLPSDFGYEDGRMVTQFVVEASLTWPKLFQVTGGSDDDQEEEEDEEEAMIRIEMAKLKLEWKEAAEQEVMAAEQKSVEAKEKALVKLAAEVEGEKKKRMKKKESSTKESSSRREQRRIEEENKEVERKEREKRRAEKARREEMVKKQAEKERKEREKARQRRIEKVEDEKKQQKIADDRGARKSETRNSSWNWDGKDKKAKRDRERTKDRLRERTNDQKCVDLLSR